MQIMIFTRVLRASERVSLVFDRQVDVFILALETSLDITCR